MGNFMGMPSSTQVSFPPPPYPIPVQRPPIIPPMRQLDIGLGPPSPFEPGRTPLPLMLPSLATRPPLVQPDGAAIVAATHPIPGGLTVQAPIDKIIIEKQISRNPAGVQQQQKTIVIQSNNQPNVLQTTVTSVQPAQQLQNTSIQYHAPNQIQMMPDLSQPRLAQQLAMQSYIPQQNPAYQPQIPFQDLFAPQEMIFQQSQNPLQALVQIQNQQILQQHIQQVSQPYLPPPQPSIMSIQQPQSQFGQPPIQNASSPLNSNIFVPTMPEIPNNFLNQASGIIQQSIIAQGLPANPISNNPTPSNVYARPVESVPIIPTRILQTVNQLKQSREFLDDSGPRGVQLPPYYIPQKHAYYEGQWINGLPGGYARIFYDSGAYFQGYFVNGEAFCKEGIWVYPDGSYYIGGIAHSTPNGLGQLVYRGKGMKYIGNWLNGKPHGQGREQFQDGSFFQGTFVNGVKQGIGKFIWSDGSFYQGQFKDGFMEGHGVQQFSNGSKFVGEFRKNKLYGKGTYISERGQYKGGFVDNKRQGAGTYRFSDGRVYAGEFKGDRQDGRGRMLIPNGQLIEGEWRNGKNVAIHNVSQSTSISQISLDDLNYNQNRMQIPDVPMTVSLEGVNPIQMSPTFPGVSNGNAQSSGFYYSANYRPQQQSRIYLQTAQLHQ